MQIQKDKSTEYDDTVNIYVSCIIEQELTMMGKTRIVSYKRIIDKYYNLLCFSIANI